MGYYLAKWLFFFICGCGYVKINGMERVVKDKKSDFTASRLWTLRFVCIVLTIGAVFSSWILFLRANSGLELNLPKYLVLGFLLLILVGVFYVLYKRKQATWLANKWFLTTLVVASVALGILVRLLFLKFSNAYSPLGFGSDTGIHWYTGQEILQTGKISSFDAGTYEANFPYLTTYTGMVALSMNIFGVTYAAILIPNVLCDLLVAGIVYYLLLKWKGRQTATWGVVLALLNPLSVFFCVEGLALSYTNLFVALVFLGVYFLWHFLKQRQYWRYFLAAFVVGLCLSLGNAFRSLFIVFLLAIIILLMTDFATCPKARRFFVRFSGIAVILLTFMVCNFVIDMVHHQLNPYYQDKHGSLGWSFFVGANYQSSGRWSEQDWDLLSPKIYGEKSEKDGVEIVLSEPWSPTEINSSFMQAGLQRYQEMSVLNLLFHLVNKTEILFCRNEITLFRNLEEQFTNVFGVEEWYLLANDMGIWMLNIFAVLVFVFCWQMAKNGWKHEIDYFGYFIVLCFCGLFASSLLVEVMSRYISVFVVPFTVMSAVSLVNLLSRLSNKHSITKAQLAK